jgi:anti-sigma factor RsiW
VNCATCKERLSGYLDGELSDRDASALRGHLRTCAECRAAAAEEAAIVDQLRQLPPIDAPPALWQAIRGQLAHEEIADAKAPLRVRLWKALAPWMPHGVGAAAVAAAAVGLMWWQHAAPPQHPVKEANDPIGERAAQAARDATLGAPPPVTPPVVDVATALSDEVALADRSYHDAVAELDALIAEARSSWAPAYARRYDERARALRGRVDGEKAGRSRERAWQELLRFLQTSLTRAEVAMGGP